MSHFVRTLVAMACVALLAPALAAQDLPFDKPISQFVRRIHQDHTGAMWLGTNGDGVIRRKGDTIDYFSVKQGFGGVAVRGIKEDKAGNIWFGTEGGLTKYDGARFTNYTYEQGLIDNDVWALAIAWDYAAYILMLAFLFFPSAERAAGFKD